MFFLEPTALVRIANLMDIRTFESEVFMQVPVTQLCRDNHHHNNVLTQDNIAENTLTKFIKKRLRGVVEGPVD